MRILAGLLRADDGRPGCSAAIRGATGRGARPAGLPAERSGPVRADDRRDVLDHFARLGGRPPALRAAALDALALSAADLARQVRGYSRGMRQKVAIVQALQHDPELLVLDEPSEGLDPLVQEGLFALLRGRRDAGRTVFLSSHVLPRWSACASRWR